MTKTRYRQNRNKTKLSGPQITRQDSSFIFRRLQQPENSAEGIKAATAECYIRLMDNGYTLDWKRSKDDHVHRSTVMLKPLCRSSRILRHHMI
ncbi:Hypothetical predicted protein [Octopus vulgaris]|uniref:Uncharacterized protein n=1 Tax=Octopus vulgaris TaxID=6645 RepID=A0AA36BSR1_OCTVU|nr:Hypothetical predicted protein [Octopus vulgaris]